MIETKIKFHFCETDLPLLKAAAELHHRAISPTHRLEILARGCGFRTLASLKASLNHSRGSEIEFDLDPAAASEFANERGHSFTAYDLYAVLATAARPKVARENPLLHNWGFGLGCLEPKRHEREQIVAGLPIEERWSAVQNAIQNDLSERRIDLMQIQPQREFLQALAFASCIKPLKNPNMRHTSYGLKHIAEKLAFSLPGEVLLSESYVSNTNLIAAALYSGFHAHSPEYVQGYFNSSPNPEFNMSERSIKPLIEERDRRRRAA